MPDVRRESRPHMTGWKAVMQAALERSWYCTGGAWWPLRPLATLYGLVVRVRRMGYRRGWLRVERVDAPVVVVGNITVGGSGKTPLTLALIERLQARGRRVGVVSRGYGGQAEHYPLPVTAETAAAACGDEPLMIARATGVPVAVDPKRPRGARWLVEQAGVELVIADDGLQHYALARAAEIAVIDARRGLGNGKLLPAGPLREPPERLDGVDLVLRHGADADFWLAPGSVHALAGATERTLADFCHAPVHALAGIGDPARFFAMLRDAGLDVIEHPMPDHHDYCAADIRFDDDHAVLMTDKDAVKCAAFADARHWRVSAALVFSTRAEQRVEALLDRLCEHPRDMETVKT